MQVALNAAESRASPEWSWPVEPDVQELQKMLLFSIRMCVEKHFWFFIWPPHTHSAQEGKWGPCVKTLLKNYECLLNVCCMWLSRRLETRLFRPLWPAITDISMRSVLVPCVSGCPCCRSSLAENLVWWKLHIVRLRIPPTEGDLGDLLWHSICAPKREIQIHLAGGSTGSVWGNPISHTGAPHPESHLFTSELCQQNGRLNLSIQPCQKGPCCFSSSFPV